MYANMKGMDDEQAAQDRQVEDDRSSFEQMESAWLSSQEEPSDY